MPGPVSATVTNARPSSSPVRSVIVPPSGIASIALTTRLTTARDDLLGPPEHRRRPARAPRRCGRGRRRATTCAGARSPCASWASASRSTLSARASGDCRLKARSRSIVSTPRRMTAPHLVDALVGLRRVSLGRRPLDELRVQRQRVQDVLEIVRQARGHLAERAQLLGPGEHLARRAQLGVDLRELRELRGPAHGDGRHVGQAARESAAARRSARARAKKQHQRAEEPAAADERAAGRRRAYLPPHECEELRCRARCRARRRLLSTPRHRVGHVAGRRHARATLLGQLHDDGAVGPHMIDRSVGEERQDLGARARLGGKPAESHEDIDGSRSGHHVHAEYSDPQDLVKSTPHLELRG